MESLQLPNAVPVPTTVGTGAFLNTDTLAIGRVNEECPYFDTPVSQRSCRQLAYPTERVANYGECFVYPYGLRNAFAVEEEILCI